MVTVLIFSYNRPAYLRRAIAYWKLSGWPVIIADGSENRLQYDFTMNIVYLHRPLAPLLVRIGELAQKVITPYAVLCADDDFIAFGGLRAITEYLECNPDYASAQGFYTRFAQSHSSEVVDWRWDYRYASRYLFDEESFELRFGAAMKPPLMHYCYSVMRTNVLRKALTLLHGVEETSISTFEMSFVPALMSCGKHITVPVFFGARQAQPQRWASQVRFEDWVARNSPDGYARWRSNICNLFRDERGISKADAERILDKTMGECIDGFRKKDPCRKTVLELDQSLRAKIQLRVAERLAERHRQALRSLLAPVRSLWHLYQMFGLDLERLGSFRQDWSRIKSVILANPIDDSIAQP